VISLTLDNLYRNNLWKVGLIVRNCKYNYNLISIFHFHYIDVVLEQSLQKIEEIVGHDLTKREAVAERLRMIPLESFENFLTRHKTTSSVESARESFCDSPEPVSSPTQTSSLRQPW